MKIIENIKELHSSLGFNLFALSGLLSCYPLIYYYLINDKILLLILSIIFEFINLIIIILWLLEPITNLKIKNNFLLNNIYIKIIRYIGCLLNLVFLIYISIVCLYLTKLIIIFHPFKL